MAQARDEVSLWCNIVEATLRRCILVTAEQKLIHCDIQWRHVAFFPVLKKNFFFGIFSGGNTQQLNVQCMFIDLTNMKTAESVRDAESLIMLGDLVGLIVLPCVRVSQH